MRGSGVGFVRCCSMCSGFCWLSLAGMCARRRTSFSCAHKKSRQKKAPPSLRPLRVATGQTCVTALAGCAAELTARCALRSDNRGESVDEARASCGARATPQAPRRRRSPRGFQAGHRCARPRTGIRGQAQRWPVLPLGPLWPCREAQGLGRAWAAQHAHASCTDLLRLSERSAQRAASSAAPPRARASQAARSAAKGHGQWGRLSFAFFALATQKKEGALPGAHPGRQMLAASATKQAPMIFPTPPPLTPALSPKGRGSKDLKPHESTGAKGQPAHSTTGTSVAGGVLRLRPQRTRPSIMTMPMPGMSPS